MPIKEYKCDKCGKEYEKLHRSQDEAQTYFELGCISPCCNYPSARKISAPAPAQFKGSGFYGTDYKKWKRDF